MSFKDVAARIAQKDNVPQGNANAILAAATRKASPAAKKANPALNRVPGKSSKQPYKNAAARMIAMRRNKK